MMQVIDNPLFLAAFAAITLTAGFVAAAINRKCCRQSKAQAPSASVGTSGVIGHLLLVAVVTFLCVAGLFMMLPHTAEPFMPTGGHAYDVLFCTWLALNFVCGCIWHATFVFLYERKNGAKK